MRRIAALLMLYEPVKRLNGIHNIFQQAVGASQKVFEYLDRRIAVLEVEQGRNGGGDALDAVVAPLRGGK